MKTIFDQETLGKQNLKNRIIRSATWMATADEGGYVTDQIIDTYHELAQGDAGGIITGMTSVSPVDACVKGELRFHDDSYIAGHRKLTDTVHASGSRIYMQAAMTESVSLNADGRLREREIDSWTESEIGGIVGLFGDAGARAEKAGYDGIQIHAAHFWFLSRFISPVFNHRQDKYGGSAENRARILLEVLQDIREKTGDSVSVIVKINCTDAYPEGAAIDDFLTSSKLLAEAGIDGIEISANGTSAAGIRPGVNEAYYEEAAALLRKVVDVPIILVGGHRSIENAVSVKNLTETALL